MSARLCIASTLACVLLLGGLADAKNLKVSTPGRSIYNSHETFGSVVNQDSRTFVVEVAMGSGPEGNLGVSLGWLVNRPEGLEFYAGFGSRIGPVVHNTLSVRYFLPFVRYRAYVSGGYLLQRNTNLDLWSNHVYGEVGYKWIIGHTFHVTLGVGLQRAINRTVRESSVLLGDDVDQESLQEQLDLMEDYRPTVALRFSRAF